MRHNVEEQKVTLESEFVIGELLEDILDCGVLNDESVVDLIKYIYVERLNENEKETGRLFNFFKEQENDFIELRKEEER